MSKKQSLKDLYQEDGYGWYYKNAELLKKGKTQDADLANIAEELESMGKSEEYKLERYLTLILLHLLKWKYQPSKRSRSWQISIKQHRIHYKRHLNKNPSLKGHLDEIIQNAYTDARLQAEQETGLSEDTFPEKMPFVMENALMDDWLPE